MDDTDAKTVHLEMIGRAERVIPHERSECRDLLSLHLSQPRGLYSESRHSLATLTRAG